MMQARTAGGHAMGAARDLRGAARHAAYAAGQAGAVAHVAAHELGAAAYAIKASRAAASEGESEAAGRRTSTTPSPSSGLVSADSRRSQYVTQQHDADDLVGFDPARDDPLGQVPGVVLQRLDAAGLRHPDVVVVHRGRLREDLLRGHRREQLGVGDPVGPLPPQLRPVLAPWLSMAPGSPEATRTARATAAASATWGSACSPTDLLCAT